MGVPREGVCAFNRPALQAQGGTGRHASHRYARQHVLDWPARLVVRMGESAGTETEVFALASD
eukprot:361542-Prymnesium_polylepis.1